MGAYMRCGGIRWWVLLALAVPTLAAQAQDVLPDRRSGRPPVVSGSVGSSSEVDKALRQSVLDLQQQLEQLQTEQRQLRDTVEVQVHEIEQLKARQRDLLAIYGYPYVMEEFRFHLTLSGPMTDAETVVVAKAAEAHFAGLVPQPFLLADICLMAEDASGRFHLLHRYALND